MRAAREDARTQTEGGRRHVTKSEQSPNRLEQNQKRPKPELKPVKRYEHLTGFDASNSDPCFSPPGLGATYASRGTPSGASASRAASLGSPFETHPSFLPKSAATTKTTIGYK